MPRVSYDWNQPHIEHENCSENNSSSPHNSSPTVDHSSPTVDHSSPTVDHSSQAFESQPLYSNSTLDVQTQYISSAPHPQRPIPCTMYLIKHNDIFHLFIVHFS